MAVYKRWPLLFSLSRLCSLSYRSMPLPVADAIPLFVRSSWFSMFWSLWKKTLFPFLLRLSLVRYDDWNKWTLLFFLVINLFCCDGLPLNILNIEKSFLILVWLLHVPVLDGMNRNSSTCKLSPTGSKEIRNSDFDVVQGTLVMRRYTKVKEIDYIDCYIVVQSTKRIDKGWKSNLKKQLLNTIRLVETLTSTHAWGHLLYTARAWTK